MGTAVRVVTKQLSVPNVSNLKMKYIKYTETRLYRNSYMCIYEFLYTYAQSIYVYVFDCMRCNESRGNGGFLDCTATRGYRDFTRPDHPGEVLIFGTIRALIKAHA